MIDYFVPVRLNGLQMAKRRRGSVAILMKVPNRKCKSGQVERKRVGVLKRWID